MTSQGSSYQRFRLSLKTRNPVLVRTAAAELPRIGLPDAAEICSVFAERDRELFAPAAVRWIYRLCIEHRSTRIEDVMEAAAAFERLERGGERDATRDLRELAERVARLDRAAA